MELSGFLIPAIDIKDGSVVRLSRGEFDKKTVYPYEPQELADIFNSAGFKRLHVVDLDGAREGRPRNIGAIRQIRKRFSGIIQMGGGLRNLNTVRAVFDEGVDLAILGTLPLEKRAEFERILAEFPERIIVSIDSRSGLVSVKGWQEKTELTPEEMVRTFDSDPIWGFLYTQIERDGTLEGVSPQPYRRIKEITTRPVLASGGVSSLEDVKALAGVVDGVVVGKAIYEGRIPIKGLRSGGYD